MSSNPPTIEWYIARDGSQHGPISDVEMLKFVELGHLRPTDLVWCARFTQWQTGAQAFPDKLAPRPAPPAAVAAPAQVREPAMSAPAPAAATAAVQAQVHDRQDREDAAWASAMQPVAQAPVYGGPGGGASAMPAPSSQLDDDARAAGSGRSGAESDDFDDEPTRKRGGRGFVGMATVALAVLLIVGGLGWFAWQNRTLISGASAVGSAITSVVTSQPSSEFLRAAPFVAPGETRADIDASLQKIAVWRVLRREFPDWYQGIVEEVEKRRGMRVDERVVTQFLVDVIVTLRRRNAQAALQASPEHLRAMAGAFVANLKQLGSRDGATCYAFITHGEASPFMIELSKTPGFAETLQKQIIAVFSAVVDARAARKIHGQTRRTDYDALTEELTKQRGWTQQDLMTFSDPQKLSTTLPDKVCTLVQEWFTTQLSLKDTELQTRLLAESLKPLVGG